MTEGKESSKFFEHGLVELRSSDFVRRQALLHLCAPNCLFQAVTPTLLGSGFVDEFKIMMPVAAWVPQLAEERFQPALAQRVPHLAERCNLSIKQRVDEILRTFTDVASFAQFPGDLVPMLPLGTYVECSYRCELDSMPKILDGIGSTPVPGAHELQWALAEVLAYALEDAMAWEAARRRLPSG